MLSSRKKYPAFEDTDIMFFGQYEGEPLSDIPARYFRWYWENAIGPELKDLCRNVERISEVTPYTAQCIKLANYIWNSQDALAQELGETFI